MFSKNCKLVKRERGTWSDYSYCTFKRLDTGELFQLKIENPMGKYLKVNKTYKVDCDGTIYED